MKFGIIGCGYVGLTTAVAISKTSKVFIWDIDNIKLKNIPLFHQMCYKYIEVRARRRSAYDYKNK